MLVVVCSANVLLRGEKSRASLRAATLSVGQAARSQLGGKFLIKMIACHMPRTAVFGDYFSERNMRPSKRTRHDSSERVRVKKKKLNYEGFQEQFIKNSLVCIIV